MFGFLSLFAIFLLTFFIPVFATNDLTTTDFFVYTSDIDPMQSSYADGGMSMGTDSLMFILSQFASILIFAVPLIAGLSLIIAGYYYIFSSGDSEKASKAKTIIKWNVVAMIVAFLSYGLVNLVLYILHLN